MTEGDKLIRDALIIIILIVLGWLGGLWLTGYLGDGGRYDYNLFTHEITDRRNA